jgi:hypothetical protein
LNELQACLLAHSAYGAPQRGVQLGGGGSRPVTYGSPQAPQQPNYGPNYSQQLTFGPADAGIRSTPGAYRSPQPILIQQGSPSTPAPFPSFSQSASPFPSGGPSRGPIRGPSTPSPNDDEYEEYDDDDEPPQKPQIQQRPIQRAPARVSQPNSFSQGSQRLILPQSQPQVKTLVMHKYENFNGFFILCIQQQVRQRQSTPQRGPPSQQYSPQPQTPRVQAPPQQQQQQQSRGQQVPSYGLDGKRTRLTTPPPVQTLNRYMKNNDDGSITWGYENEDGTFKEETIGVDCVVRGKYG